MISKELIQKAQSHPAVASSVPLEAESQWPHLILKGGRLFGQFFFCYTHIEGNVLYIEPPRYTVKLVQYADSINLAIVSLDMEGGAELGLSLYHQNQDCYILYIRETTCDLEPFLCARPISFYGGPIPSKPLEEKLRSLCREIWNKSGMLHYSSKNLTGLLPYRRISYAESDLKYVLIHTVGGTKLRLYRKLEAELSDGGFLRVHKSYLINLSAVACLDKAERMLHLQTGEEIPVNRSYYEKTVEAISAYSPA